MDTGSPVPMDTGSLDMQGGCVDMNHKEGNALLEPMKVVYLWVPWIFVTAATKAAVTKAAFVDMDWQPLWIDIAAISIFS
jgi:hypothetical protein